LDLRITRAMVYEISIPSDNGCVQRQQNVTWKNGAGDGDRTRDIQLGNLAVSVSC
jgi:hypothetical protein